ncbi:MAG: hypothetical protein EXR45_07410 [Chloroflexi bacterium]|nr:hypothetical protein [Chloroflexota bacterium]
MNGWQAASLASQFGFAVISGLAGGVIFGGYIDRQLGTAPVFLLVGLLGGFLVSLYLMYAIYRLQVVNRAGPHGRSQVEH